MLESRQVSSIEVIPPTDHDLDASPRQIAGGLHLLRVTAGEPAPRALARLRADPQVLYADLDQRRFPLASPDDPLFAGQWYMQDTQPAAVAAVDAWTLTTGSNGVVIAALDTGVRFDHPDLRSGSANRLLPGYDMISSVQTGNTGEGRNADASDPGDWVTKADTKTALFANCTVANSSWHGTRVAGILGAITNNSTGIAGLTWWLGAAGARAGAAATTRTSSPRWRGLPVSRWPAYRTIRIRRASST